MRFIGWEWIDPIRAATSNPTSSCRLSGKQLGDYHLFWCMHRGSQFPYRRYANLRWRQAATRKAVPTNIAAMPPNIAKELPPERSFRSAWCWFTMISIPKIEKPSDKLTKLTRVEIICSVWLMVFSYQSKAELRFSGFIRRACVDDRKWNKRPGACPRDIFLVGDHASVVRFCPCTQQAVRLHEPFQGGRVTYQAIADGAQILQMNFLDHIIVG